MAEPITTPETPEVTATPPVTPPATTVETPPPATPPTATVETPPPATPPTTTVETTPPATPSTASVETAPPETNTKMAELVQQKSTMAATIEAMKQGAIGDNAEDLVAIALTKVTDSKDIKAVISELKELPAYAGFFKKAEAVSTGTTVVGKKAGTTTESIGTRLAQQTARPTQKNPYFN